MNFYGIVLAVITFLIIGVFHPIVIKAEYHLTASNTIVSCILGVTGCSCMWSIKELKEQKERVRKGWFPANPARGGDAKRQVSGEAGCGSAPSCREGMADVCADNVDNTVN